MEIKMLRKRIVHFFFALAVMAVNPVATTCAEAQKPRATAVFAMGCFWCAEADFEKVPGVVNVVSGYTGGRAKNPTYEQVSAGTTGHYEAVLVTYDPAKVKYSQLLSVFWKNVDPFDAAGQFCDKGSSYRAAIFPGNAAERKAAQASRDYLADFFKRDLATKIINRTAFYAAEEYHQDYYKKNPIRYRYYRNGCGRDDRLAQVWGK
jgi:peptide-methionine (S)-S-oxide reductase